VSRGVLGLVGLAGTLAFALPAAALGLQYVADGRPIGWGLIGAAALMLVAEERITGPGELPDRAAERAADRLRPDEQE
jgi:hypothetical protein